MIVQPPEPRARGGQGAIGRKARLITAFATVYLVWGSTYLAIRVAIETLPPFLMAGVRFAVAGAVLYGWARLRGAARPTIAEWVGGTVAGVLLLAGGNGGVVWAEQTVASGLTALVIGSEPLWVVLMDWARPHGRRPGLVTGLGLGIGFAGVALLVAPTWDDGAAVHPAGAVVLTLASISWAAGSIVSRTASAPASPALGTGQKMLAGGGVLILMALISGELHRFHVADVSTRSLLALAYLIVAGAIAAFSAYLWLLRHTTLARASTYAYVNPVVATVLGRLVLHEPLTPRTLVAAAIIVTGVFVITRGTPAASTGAGRQGAS